MVSSFLSKIALDFLKLTLLHMQGEGQSWNANDRERLLQPERGAKQPLVRGLW
jgi:hypothetical protein